MNTKDDVKCSMRQALECEKWNHKSFHLSSLRSNRELCMSTIITWATSFYLYLIILEKFLPP